MKQENIKMTGGYIAPAVTALEYSFEGVLCASYGNESFKGMGEDDKAPSYGTGIEDFGWY